MPSDLLRTTAAAERLGVTDKTLREWVKTGKIAYVRLPSGQVRFRPSDLDAVLTPVEPAEAAS